MSMPAFPESSAILNHDEAVNAVLTSIAMEETALSHIINAEGEKIQYAIENAKKLESASGSKPGSDIRMILDVNDSVTAMLEQITDLQFILLNKLNKTLKRTPHYKRNANECRNDTSCGQRGCAGCRGTACAYRKGPRNPVSSRRARVSEFTVLPGYKWRNGSALYLEAGSRRDMSVKLCSRNGESAIILPSKGRFSIILDIEAHNGIQGSSAVEICLAASGAPEAGPDIVASRRYSFGPKTNLISLSDTLDWDTPKDLGAVLKIKLISPEYLSVRGGAVKIYRQD